MKSSPCWCLIATGLAAFAVNQLDAAEIKPGVVVTKQIVSSVLRGTRTGVALERTIKVYLPPGYAESQAAYPVVYFCHNIFQSPAQVLADGKLQALLDRGFGESVVRKFILVVGDYTSPTTGSVYENTPTTGRWLDYTVEELVPFIDREFRTLRAAESRAVVGEMMGGGGALMLAMRHPDVFSTVYALNPVRMGTGLLPLQAYPNWTKIHQAKSPADLAGDPISQIFVSFGQAFSPNPERPPFYCDFIMEMENGRLVYQPETARKQLAGFSVSLQMDQYAANLRKLRGIALDWSRYDPIQDHVYATQAFSRKLETFGIEHEAEEYRGVYWNENWREGGRFAARVLPFLERNLTFEVQ